MCCSRNQKISIFTLTFAFSHNLDTSCLVKRTTAKMTMLVDVLAWETDWLTVACKAKAIVLVKWICCSLSAILFEQDSTIWQYWSATQCISKSVVHWVCRLRWACWEWELWVDRCWSARWLQNDSCIIQGKKFGLRGQYKPIQSNLNTIKSLVQTVPWTYCAFRRDLAYSSTVYKSWHAILIHVICRAYLAL